MTDDLNGGAKVERDYVPLSTHEKILKVEGVVKTERFSNDCRKTSTKVITRGYVLPVTSLKAREKSRVQLSAIVFYFASHWLKNWREIFKQSQSRDNFRQSFENCSIRVNL